MNKKEKKGNLSRLFYGEKVCEITKILELIMNRYLRKPQI